LIRFWQLERFFKFRATGAHQSRGPAESFRVACPESCVSSTAPDPAEHRFGSVDLLAVTRQAVLINNQAIHSPGAIAELSEQITEIS
jgi:hypothetical protein